MGAGGGGIGLGVEILLVALVAVLILLWTFSLLDRLLTIFTLNVKQCCFKQHSKGEWKNNKFDLEISLLPKSKLELKKLEHFFFKMCHDLVFMKRETFDTFSTLIFSTYSPGSKLNSRNLLTPIMNELKCGTWQLIWLINHHNITIANVFSLQIAHVCYRITLYPNKQKQKMQDV